MNISDDDINCILDVTDDVGHMWKEIKDDDMVSEEIPKTERMKTYLLPVDEYVK
jgi:hypothetical protein